MSYDLQLDEPVRAGLRRVAREQATEVLASLHTAADGRERTDGSIHDARKRFKKLRAVLRLVRHDMGEAAYGAENRAFRDAGRLLADVRESAVAPGTVQTLFPSSEGDAPIAEPIRKLLARLRDRHRSAIDTALGPYGALRRASSIAGAARDRIDAWPLERDGFTSVEPGLRTVYERGRDAMAEALEDPSGPRFHEWRKRAKYLWYHLRILTPLWPDLLRPWAASQHDLCDLLGEGNDLSDLRALLDEEPRLVADGTARESLRERALERRRELWGQARPLGLRLYAETADAFVERMGAFWTAGRAPGSPRKPPTPPPPPPPPPPSLARREVGPYVGSPSPRGRPGPERAR